MEELSGFGRGYARVSVRTEAEAGIQSWFWFAGGQIRSFAAIHCVKARCNWGVPIRWSSPERPFKDWELHGSFAMACDASGDALNIGYT